MIVNTKFYGELDIDESKVISFDDGIPGFENNHKYILLDIDSKTTIKCLQSTDSIDLCLIIISPWDYLKDYEIELFDEDILSLQINSENDVLVYNVLTIRGDKVTANFIAPIVINASNNKAKQIVFSNSNYSIRQEISCLY